jgi:hypothetical protein
MQFFSGAEDLIPKKDKILVFEEVDSWGPIRIPVPAADLPGTEQFIRVLISRPIDILLGQTK